MRLALPLLLALSLASPAFSLEPQLADGDWMCDVRDAMFGLRIEGESYRFTVPDVPERTGTLALELDGVTCYVESGPLREGHELTQIKYQVAEGEKHLELATGDLGAITPIGGCFRPLL